MTVGRICQREVDLADPEETAEAAAIRMAERNVGTLIVLDEEENPVGILTDRDLTVRLVARGDHPREVRVDDLMTPFPETVSEDTPIEDALAHMRDLGIRRLPVVDVAGKLAGVVSLDDVLLLLAEEFAQIGRLLEGSSPQVTAESGA